MPINDRMHPHKVRPPVVRAIKVRQELAVGVCPARTDEDSLHGWFLAEVGFEGFLHGEGVAREIEVVVGDADVDEVVNFGEGVGGHYEYSV